MNSARKLNPSHPDTDNPEWTQQDMVNARPASEVLPGLIGTSAAQELFRRDRGRVPSKPRESNQTIRVDPDVLAAYQRQGEE